MEAVISGRARTALVIEAGKLFSIHARAPDEIIPRRPTEFPLLFAGANDLLFYEDVDSAFIEAELQTAANSEDSLHSLLLCFDADVPKDTRKGAFSDLDALLSAQAVRERLERTLFSHELPNNADRLLVNELCRLSDHERASQFVQRLLDLQPFIVEVRRAWDKLAASNIALCGIAGRNEYFAELVNGGWFRQLVTCVAERSADGFNDVVAAAFVDSFLSKTDEHKELFHQLVRALDLYEEEPAHGTVIVDGSESIKIVKPTSFKGLNALVSNPQTLSGKDFRETGSYFSHDARWRKTFATEGKLGPSLFSYYLWMLDYPISEKIRLPFDVEKHLALTLHSTRDIEGYESLKKEQYAYLGLVFGSDDSRLTRYKHMFGSRDHITYYRRRWPPYRTQAMPTSSIGQLKDMFFRERTASKS